MFMSNLLKLLVFITILLISCSTSNPVSPGGFDVDTIKPDVSVVDTDTVDNGITNEQDAVIVVDTEGSVTNDTDTAPAACKTDNECGKANICISAKCATGCKSDADCTAYKGTQCNTSLGRCLNLIASSAACSVSKCTAGCCYAAKGMISLACLKTADIKICGFCKQGEIYMDSKECIASSCDTSTDKCSSFNSTDPAYKCFACNTDKICYKNPNCKTGSGLMVNVLECTPAGEACTGSTGCCAGTPCIQGYCY